MEYRQILWTEREGDLIRFAIDFEDDDTVIGVGELIVNEFHSEEPIDSVTRALVHQSDSLLHIEYQSAEVESFDEYEPTGY